ncbi:hypothetical protein C0J52_18680 [Blattella germanica]|nr:hypothetical protein C0J52_18680 [Blattella germanica]
MINRENFCEIRQRKMEGSEKTEYEQAYSRYVNARRSKTQFRKYINTTEFSYSTALQRLIKDKKRYLEYRMSPGTEIPADNKSTIFACSQISLQSKHFIPKCKRTKLSEDTLPKVIVNCQSDVGTSGKGINENNMEDVAEGASADHRNYKTPSISDDEPMEEEYLEDAFDSTYTPNEHSNMLSEDVTEAYNKYFSDISEQEGLNTAEECSASSETDSCVSERQDFDTSNDADKLWKKIPNEICRLCAKANDMHPKQSIVKWLGLLNEIVPGMVYCEDGLPQLLCAPCGKKLYTCIKSKMEFIEADELLQKKMGFVKKTNDDLYEVKLDNVVDLEQVSVCDTINETRDIVNSENYSSGLRDTWEGVDSQFEAKRDENFLCSSYQKESGNDNQNVGIKEGFTCDNEEAREDGASSPDSDTYEVDYLLPEFYDDDLLNGDFVNESLKNTNDIEILLENAENKSLDSTNSVETLDEAVKDKCANEKEFLVGNAIEEGEKMIDTRTRENSESVAFHKCEEEKNSSVIKCRDDQLVQRENVENNNKTTEETNSNCALKETRNDVKKTKQLFNCRQKPKIDCICTDCEEVFPTMKILHQHRTLHHSDRTLPLENADTENEYICEECGAVFTSKIKFISHKSYHSRLKPKTNLKCHICSKKFAIKSHLTYHLIRHSTKKSYICEYCLKSFMSEEQLKLHELIHFPPTIPCFECTKLFCTRTDLLLHMKQHSFICEICGESLSCRYDLDTHLRLHEPRPYKCTICGENFVSKPSLVYHKAIHSNKSLSCDICQKTFKRKKSLSDHMNSHTQKLKIACPICKKIFSTKGNLIRHLKAACKYIICIVCRETLSTIADLEEHRLTQHSKEEFKEAAKSYNVSEFLYCATCSLHITGIPAMEKHMASEHDVTKLFKCIKCTWCFLNDEQLQEHSDSCRMKLASEVPLTRKPKYDGKCKICLKFISLKRNDVKKHILQFHKDYRPFHCKFCPKTFPTDYGLRRHRLRHNNILAYTCRKCNQKFENASILRRHINSIHLSTVSVRPEFQEKQT